MNEFDPRSYGSACTALLRDLAVCPLDAGRPQRDRRPLLEDLSLDALADGRTVVDREMARCCLAGLWLVHNYLDESHTISQKIQTTSGSYWHGIMHRREPDFSNAKYWFRRVGAHPIFGNLAELTRELADAAAPNSLPAGPFQERGWDPLIFVDACRTALHESGPRQRLCEEIARHEWQLLFDYCYCQAFAEAA